MQDPASTGLTERGKARNQLLYSQRVTSTETKTRPPTTGCQCSYRLQPQLPAWSQTQVWSLTSGMCLLLLGEHRRAVGWQRRAGVGECTGERASPGQV